MMKCRNCGQELKGGTKICSNCGADTEKEKPTCPHCGTVNSLSVKRCRFCGKSMQPQISDEPLKEETPPVEIVPEPLLTELKVEKSKRYLKAYKEEVSELPPTILEPIEEKLKIVEIAEFETADAVREREEKKRKELKKLKFKQAYSIISVILAVFAIVTLLVSGMTMMSYTDGVLEVEHDSFYRLISPQRVYDIYDYIAAWEGSSYYDQIQAEMTDQLIVQMLISALAMTAIVALAALLVILIIRVVKFFKNPNSNVGCIASKIFFVSNLTLILISTFFNYSDIYDNGNYLTYRLSITTAVMMLIGTIIFICLSGVGIVARTEEKLSGFAIAMKVNLALMLLISITVTWLFGTGMYRIRFDNDNMTSTCGSVLLGSYTSGDMRRAVWVDYLTSSILEQSTIVLFFVICVFLFASMYTAFTSGKGVLATMIFSGLISVVSLMYFLFAAMTVEGFVAANNADITINMISYHGYFVVVGGALLLVLSVLTMGVNVNLKTKQYKQQKETLENTGRYTR